MKKYSSAFLIFIEFWMPLLAWMTVIFVFSSMSGIPGGATPLSEIFIRKMAHVIEYAILAWLIWRLMAVETPRRGVSTGWYIFYAWVFTVFYAFTDEFHQTFVYGRTGRTLDVFLDIAAAFLVLQVIGVYNNASVETPRRGVSTTCRKHILAIILSLLIIAGIITANLIQGKKALDEKTRKDQFKGYAATMDSAENIPEQSMVVEDIVEQEIREDYAEVEPSLLVSPVADVPFTSQAPFRVWDETHEEMCEEASLLMVYYYSKNKDLTPGIAEDELQKLKEFQLERFRDYKDSTMEQVVIISKEYYGMKNLEAVYDFSKEDLREELEKGFPIIIPAAGRMLGNPNFTSPGPLYHNLVLKKIEGNTVITNDPGTRKGENYEYSLDVIYDAIHDFPGEKEKIKEGRKAMVVFR